MSPTSSAERVECDEYISEPAEFVQIRRNGQSGQPVRHGKGEKKLLIDAKHKGRSHDRQGRPSDGFKSNLTWFPTP